MIYKHANMKHEIVVHFFRFNMKQAYDMNVI